MEIPATVTMWEEFEPVIIKAEDLILREILGAGNFGQVYQGQWIRRSGGHEIAVSWLFEYESHDDKHHKDKAIKNKHIYGYSS